MIQFHQNHQHEMLSVCETMMHMDIISSGEIIMDSSHVQVVCDVLHSHDERELAVIQ